MFHSFWNSTQRTTDCMCQNRNARIRLKRRKFRLDLCMRRAILDMNSRGYETLGCCCGHGKYQSTIVLKVGFFRKSTQVWQIEMEEEGFRIRKKIKIPRIRNFYKRDKEGIFYIPELIRC